MSAPIVIELDLRHEPEPLNLGFRRDELLIEGHGLVLRVALRADQKKGLARLLGED